MLKTLLNQASMGLIHNKNQQQVMLSFMQHVFSEMYLGGSLVLSVGILY